MLLAVLALLTTAAIYSQTAAAYELRYDGKGCAVYAENVGDRPEASITRFTGTGLPPGGGVVLRNAEGFPESLFAGESVSYADDSGTATWQRPYWVPKLVPDSTFGMTPTRNTELDRLEMTDLFESTVYASVDVNIGVIAGTIQVKGDPRNSRKKGTWKISGLGTGNYYAFYLKKGKVASRVKLGKATGTCGYLSAKAFTQPKKSKGKYTIVVQNGPKLDLGANHVEATYFKDVYAKVTMAGKYATR